MRIWILLQVLHIVDMKSTMDSEVFRQNTRNSGDLKPESAIGFSSLFAGFLSI